MNEVDKYAKIIWDYMLMRQEIKPADLILVCGNDDEMTSERTVEVFLKKLAPIVLISGSGSTKNMPGLQDGEAVRMAEYVKEHGVSNESILIEDKARSTGDNALFSKELLEKNNIQPKSIILITKPYMERRVYATFNKQWPGPEYVVTSKDISYEDYSQKFPDKDHFINLMVGDLIRIKEYPKIGFQIEQDIPEEVWQAGQELIKMGYNKFLLK